MQLPGERKPLGALLRLDEFERLLRKGPGGRALGVALIAAGWPVLMIAAWVLGPLTPASHWYPIAFFSVLVAFAPLTALSGRVLRVLAGESMPYEQDAKSALLAKVRVGKAPFDVCTDCLAMFDVEHEGVCPACRQKFTVMRVNGEREVRRLDALLGSPP